MSRPQVRQGTLVVQELSGYGYAVACLRYTAGETPTCRMNQCDKWLCDEKPDDSATSTTGKSVLRSSSLARSMRRASTYWCGDCPMAALNARARYSGLISTSAAMACRLRSPSRL